MQSKLWWSLTAGLLLSCSPVALHAETNAELAAELKALRSQIREMKAAIADTRVETRRTQAKVRAVASRSPAPVYVPPSAPPLIPAGATPAFVTADKKLQFGAITITPGGFLAAESVFRSRTTQSDINSDFRAIPFGNNPLAHTNESRLTARQSRVALLAEGAITPTFVAAGYMELDFLGAPNTANSNESNSYAPRIRHLYATLDNNDYGMHVLAGQNWSLVTLNSKGITPRNEVTPPTIEAQYVPGFAWARQAQIRLTKDFGQRLWVSLSAEESQTTFSTGCAGGGNNAPSTYGLAGTFGNGNTLTGITCGATGTGGGFAGDTNVFSLNHVPDVVGKVAYEAGLADRDIHLEALGLYRDLYDRVSFTDALGNGQNINRNTAGYGVGGGIIVPVLPKRLDFQASGLFGKGIGRYGTSQLADTTFNGDGSLSGIREGMLLGGLTLHATPAIDIYGFAGIERQFRNYVQNSNGSFSGLGAPTAVTGVQMGCNVEPNQAMGASCVSTSNANNKQIFQITGGFWDKIYKGSFGEVRVGAQYSFTERQVFNNTYSQQFGVQANGYQPKANDHMVFTSLRYYPFQ